MQSNIDLSRSSRSQQADAGGFGCWIVVDGNLIHDIVQLTVYRITNLIDLHYLLQYNGEPAPAGRRQDPGP